MYFFPTVVIDDFFKDPLAVREYALSLDYYPGKNYSGIRTNNLIEDNPWFANEVCMKLLASCGIPVREYKAEVNFHLTGKEFGESGWPHQDYEYYEGSIFASVTYLTPKLHGVDNGTSLYKIKKFEDTSNSWKDMQETFQTGEDTPDKKKKYLSNFEETVRIGGAFNRMTAYDARKPHCGNNYFGETKEDTRLTMLVFFKNLQISMPQGHTPILYADMMSNI